MATVVKEVEGYRLSSQYDGGYIIEKYRDDDWRLCFGVDSRAEGCEYLKNPDSIERQIKHYKRTGWFILGLFIFCIVMLSACTTPKNIVQESALINSHDSKYIYVIGDGTYKTDVQLNVGDTVSPILLNKFLRIR